MSAALPWQPGLCQNVVPRQHTVSGHSVRWLTLSRTGGDASALWQLRFSASRAAAGGTLRMSALPTMFVRFWLCSIALYTGSAAAQSVSVPTLAVDPTVSRQPISSQIYGIAKLRPRHELRAGDPSPERSLGRRRRPRATTGRSTRAIRASTGTSSVVTVRPHRCRAPRRISMVKTYAPADALDHDSHNSLREQVRGVELQFPRIGIRTAAIH